MLRKLTMIILFFALFSVGAVSAETPTTARYRATFISTWSQETHPHFSGKLPNSAHWSVLVGGTHNDSITFWEVGQLASAGIKDVAERGSNGNLRGEIGAAITAGSADAVLEDNELLFNDTGTLVMEFDVISTYDRVTLVTMIAPSPDWFTGLNAQPLRDSSGNWLDEITVDLFPYDAGTDSGTDYTSGNAVTFPAQPIASAQGVTPFSAVPLGTLTFTRLTSPTAITLDSSGVGQINHTILLVVALFGLLTVQLVWCNSRSYRAFIANAANCS
jgi:hypothetical protein